MSHTEATTSLIVAATVQELPAIACTACVSSCVAAATVHKDVIAACTYYLYPAALQKRLKPFLASIHSHADCCSGRATFLGAKM